MVEKSMTEKLNFDHGGNSTGVDVKQVRSSKFFVKLVQPRFRRSKRQDFLSAL